MEGGEGVDGNALTHEDDRKIVSCVLYSVIRSCIVFCHMVVYCILSYGRVLYSVILLAYGKELWSGLCSPEPHLMYLQYKDAWCTHYCTSERVAVMGRQYRVCTGP